QRSILWWLYPLVKLNTLQHAMQPVKVYGYNHY
ncbi:hypothetical protein A2U01_0112014, partial [Trifolium medium]|nr:hypothetical protein [Trifolium medium]